MKLRPQMRCLASECGKHFEDEQQYWEHCNCISWPTLRPQGRCAKCEGHLPVETWIEIFKCCGAESVKACICFTQRLFHAISRSILDGPKGRILPKMAFLRENGSALLVSDGIHQSVELPIAEVPPPEAVVGFQMITVRYFDAKVFSFLWSISHLLNDLWLELNTCGHSTGDPRLKYTRQCASQEHQFVPHFDRWIRSTQCGRTRVLVVHAVASGAGHHFALHLFGNTGIMILAFSNVVNSNLLPESEWPRTALDYLKPNLTNQKLVVTYPNDDDAVLFWFKQVIDKYGWQWMERFAAQKPRYVRGTEDPSVFLGNGSGVASMSTFAAATDFLNTTSGSVLRFSYPTDNDPFTLWAQYAGILRGAKHPEAAKLYMNWAIANQMDSSTMLWSVRTDAPPPPFGVPRAWEVPNTSHKAFEAFMADRAEVERLKAQIALYIGEPQGPPSPGYPGLRPEKALPH